MQKLLGTSYLPFAKRICVNNNNLPHTVQYPKILEPPQEKKPIQFHQNQFYFNFLNGFSNLSIEQVIEGEKSLLVISPWVPQQYPTIILQILLPNPVLLEERADNVVQVI
mmetsp:Transcript_10319/g.21224  ORF Transcript_10319/g.21224 Transcript_10319/m.21224 type:complete len:110 (+) Transcript_10319:162-491(+)